MSIYGVLMDVWDFLVLLGWKLPMLLVFAAGLWHLRHTPPHPLRRQAARAMWIVLVGIVLQWALQQLAKPLTRWLFSDELPIVQHIGQYEMAARIFQSVTFAGTLIQALGYALLLRVLFRALRSREQ